MKELAERFQIVRLLGEGGMGQVYEAIDQCNGDRVAIKRLPELSALSSKSLHLFKNEFRSLVGFSHPNIVRLGQLFQTDEGWFFSMELVRGKNMLSYIQHAYRASRSRPTRPLNSTTKRITYDTHNPSVARPAVPDSIVTDAIYDEARLRSAIVQLAHAIAALHRVNKIHRDIKPSNVLVTAEGRVVLLDFGLIAEPEQLDRSSAGELLGTPHYMAPEQASHSHAVTPAADWYALGVVLFQALSGRLPFEGGAMSTLMAKNDFPAPDIRLMVPDCPEDLADLCMMLLRRHPEARPTARTILDCLDDGELRGDLPELFPGTGEDFFVGRQDELAVLRDAFREAVAGQLSAVAIQGESGIGKTALVRHFLASLAADRAAIVLRGRCYEREFVSFKAFDEVVDGLARYLVRLSMLELRPLIPRDVDCLLTLFPALERVAPLSMSATPNLDDDPHALRNKGFAALRGLLGSLAQRRRIVIHIDDFQWTDADSRQLVTQVFGHEDAPNVLLLVTARQAVALEELGLSGARALTLVGLNHRDSLELARQTLAAQRTERGEDDLETLIQDAQGHPFLVAELIRHATTRDENSLVKLDDAIWARIARLSPTAVEVLKIVCVTGIPVTPSAVRRIAGVASEDFQRACMELVQASLLATASDSKFVPYHDRVRESVLDHLSAEELAERHWALATFLEQDGVGDVQSSVLVYHLQASGRHQRACATAIRAARAARESLALEKARALYLLALELDTLSADERRQLSLELAETLVALGRCAEAADAFEGAAAGAEHSERLQCYIKVAHQRLISGQVERGRAVMRDLFAEYGMSYPTTPFATMRKIVGNRIRLRLKSLEPECTDGASSQLLDQLALCEAGYQGFVLVDTMRSAYFAGLGLSLALRAKNQRYCLYFLLLEAGLRRASGSTSFRFLSAFENMRSKYPDSLPGELVAVHDNAWVFYSMQGGSGEAYENLLAAVQALASSRIAPWELIAAKTIVVLILRRLGWYREMQARFDEYMSDANLRNDRFSQRNLSTVCSVLWLVRDDPEGALAELDYRDRYAAESDYRAQYWYDLMSAVDIFLYSDAQPDWDYILHNLKSFRASGLFRVRRIATDTYWLIGRLRLAYPGERLTSLPRLPRIIRYLDKLDALYPRLLSTLLQAAWVLRKSNGRHRAIALLKEAIQLSRGLGARIHGSVARYWLAALTGDDGLRATAIQTMRADAIRNPERFARVFVPGFERETAMRRGATG